MGKSQVPRENGSLQDPKTRNLFAVECLAHPIKLKKGSKLFISVFFFVVLKVKPSQEMFQNCRTTKDLDLEKLIKSQKKR